MPLTDNYIFELVPKVTRKPVSYKNRFSSPDISYWHHQRHTRPAPRSVTSSSETNC
jgi:hypothetical protein